jgi:large subunit ribosomal protein L25
MHHTSLTMMTSRVLRPLARRIQGRHFSADPLKNPSKFVTGLSVEDVEKNEEISAFMKANFVVESEESESVAEEVVEDSVEVNPANALNIRKLTGYLRDTIREEGSRRCQTLRDGGGDVPGLLYGGDPTLGIRSSDAASKIFVKTPWPLLQRELDLYHRSFESRVYDLTIYEDESDTEGIVHRVLPTSVQRHPIQHKLFCANYLRYHAGRPIRIPIAYINEEESPALKRGGFIAPINRFISCIVEEGVPIPERLELECTGLQMKEVARLDRIIFPDGVSLSKRVKTDTFIIGTVFGRRGGLEDDEEAGEAEKTE